MKTTAARIKELESLLAQERARNKRLARDSAFGMLTRPAAFLQYKELMQDKRNADSLFVILADLDQIHNLNDSLGESEVDRRIKNAFRVRSSDVIFKARYRSGDEIIIIMRGNPARFIARLQKAIRKNGLSATIAYTKAGKDLKTTGEALSKTVHKMKASSGRGEAARV